MKLCELTMKMLAHFSGATLMRTTQSIYVLQIGLTMLLRLSKPISSHQISSRKAGILHQGIGAHICLFGLLSIDTRQSQYLRLMAAA